MTMMLTATTDPQSFQGGHLPDDAPDPENVYIYLPEAEVIAEVPSGARLLGRARPALKMSQEQQDANRVFMVFADDKPWESYWEEIQLNLRPANMNMDRLKAGLVSQVLSHSYYYEDALGRIEAVWLHEAKLYAESVFSNNPRPQMVLADIRDGLIRGVSIGARPQEYKWIEEPSEKSRGLVEAVRWTLMEITVTTGPANPRVGIQASMGSALLADLAKFRQEQSDMTMQNTITAEADPPVQGVAPETPPAAVAAATPPAPEPPAAIAAAVQADVPDAAERARVAALVDLGVRGYETSAVLAALTAGTSELEFLRANRPADTPAGERVVAAQAKPAAGPGDFNLDLLLQAEINRMHTESQERAGPSRRAMELVRASRGSDTPAIHPVAGGFLVPEELLVAEHNRLEREYSRQLARAGIQPRSMIRAAVTTTTEGVGLIDEQLLAMDFIDLLLDESSILPYMDVRRGLDQPFAFPYTVTATEADAGLENPNAALTPGTFQVGTRTMAPKRLISYFEYTPEDQVQSRNLIGTYGMLEAIRLMRDECEDHFWNGTNASGQVHGVLTQLAAARKRTYTAATGPTVKELRNLQTKMDLENMPMMGRLWVVSPAMKEFLDLEAQVEAVSELLRGDSMFMYPVQSTNHPAVPAASADFGIGMHCHPRSVTVGFFGQDVEVILDRKSGDVAGAANFQVLLLKLWNLLPKRPEWLQLIQSA